MGTLDLASIQAGIDRFVAHASGRPEQVFQVTRIGCGLAGYNDEDILALWPRQLPENVLLPGVWQRMRDPGVMRVIVAGGRDYGRRLEHKPALFHDLDRLWRKYPNLEIVSGMARGADALGYDWASARSVPVACFPAQWDRFGKPAGFIRNQLMAWYGTHLIAYWDGRSSGTKHMLDTGKRDGLKSWVRHYVN